MADQNFVHPELKAGEILLLNVKDNENFGVPPFCESVRRGEVAYITGGGEIVPNMKPLFGMLKKPTFIPRNIRITGNTDPIGMPQIKDGDVFKTVQPNTPESIKCAKAYPKSAFIMVDGFGLYRVDEVEFEYVN
jgi:hypothetical protein